LGLNVERRRASRLAAEPHALSERDPDAELLEGVARQDPAAVRSLVARKLPRLLALATRMLGDRMEAEDVAQEVFVRIWKQASRWREGEAKVDTWVHRVALNLCYDRCAAAAKSRTTTCPTRSTRRIARRHPRSARPGRARSRGARRIAGTTA
jgi:DNA-directed RNA polymerase specialized sigma subunit, sigma24 homolog